MKRQYQVAYGFGSLIGRLIGFLLRPIVGVIRLGIFDSSRRRPFLIGLYPILALVGLVYRPLFYLLGFLIVGFGISEYVIGRPERKFRQGCKQIFEAVKLQGVDGTVPIFLEQRILSDYVAENTFQSLTPVDDWLAKKDMLETCFNNKIIDIYQDEDNPRIIHLLAEREKLPETVDWSLEYMEYDNNVLAIGIGRMGVVGMDLEKQPHGFIAGETGSGKSTVMKTMIHQAIKKGYDVFLIDFKRGVSFSAFSDCIEVRYKYSTALMVLQGAVEETMSRLERFKLYGVDNIKDYNRNRSNKFPRQVIFIDELAELLKTRDKEMANQIRDSLETLTRLSRAVGIHLIMGIQRPDSTIVSGQIKNNVSYRVCGRFVDPEPSRIMLGNDSASKLPDIKGRFIVKGSKIEEVQAFRYFDSMFESKPKQILEAVEVPRELPEVKEEAVPVPSLSVEKPETKEIEFDFSDISL